MSFSLDIKAWPWVLWLEQLSVLELLKGQLNNNMRYSNDSLNMILGSKENCQTRRVYIKMIGQTSVRPFASTWFIDSCNCHAND